jgi:2-polyprenyl-6-methoxyphenol hydroxylase-like FAD-dependent oxidoreductase
MSVSNKIIIIGAGLYGLSIAAHLHARYTAGWITRHLVDASRRLPVIRGSVLATR